MNIMKFSILVQFGILSVVDAFCSKTKLDFGSLRRSDVGRSYDSYTLRSSNNNSEEIALNVDFESDKNNVDHNVINPSSNCENEQDNRNLKINELLRSTCSTDRGQFSSSTQKDHIASLISELENIPSSYPDGYNLSHDVLGTWELLYSDTNLFRSSPFFMAGRAVCKTEEEASRYDWFCDMHRAALAISVIGKVRQIISGDGRLVSEFEVKVGSVPFLSDFTPFSYSGGLPVTIDGAIVSSAGITPTSDGNAWEIFMDTVEIKGSNIPLLRQLLDAGGVKLESRKLGSLLENNVESYTNPKPIFETTYLDESIRIARDQDGKVFVYGKESKDTTNTDYGNVESDLGLLKLLEGLNDNFFKIFI